MSKKRGLLVALLVLVAMGLSGCMLFNCDPVASFTWSPATIYAGESITFTSTSTDSDGTIDYHKWEFSDGGTANGSQVLHTFADDGAYQVSLIVTDNCGAIGSITHSVTVLNPAPSIGKMTVTDLDGCDGYPYSVCHRIRAVLDNIMDVASIEPKKVVSTTIDFGDGPNSVFSGFSTTYSYKNPGTYTIVGTVVDDDGATGIQTKNITIRSYSLVPPIVRLEPARRTANLNEIVKFYIFAYDPDQNRECGGCPPPCLPPCPPPYSPCGEQEVELKDYRGFDSLSSSLGLCGESIITQGAYPRDRGIVRIRVVLIDPNENIVEIFDTRDASLSLYNPTFEFRFNMCGDWKISFIAWDDDCRCSQATGYLHTIKVALPDEC
ncbi:PKD domain-containing protein [Patescibacteria group bacterium]|nr:PKD domain-containing protein [Patescibacteria group bacterium]